MNKIFTSCFFILFIVSALSCNKQIKNNNTALLHSISNAVTESKLEEAINLLNTVETGLLAKHEYAYYTLLQIRAWDATGKNISTFDTTLVKIKDYFITINDAPKVATAYVFLARTYEKQGNSIKALLNYLQADEWVQKANCKITEFSYFRMLYNIAVLYSENKQYEESQIFLNKALQLNTENNYIHELYALELQAINLQYLKETSKALQTYNGALQIANQNNDLESKIRITQNKALLFMNDGEINDAKKLFKEIINIRSQVDSVEVGKAYMGLFEVCYSDNQMDSALFCIYKAKDLLIHADFAYAIPLYKRLYLTEQVIGNKVKAKEYEDHYNQLKTEQLNIRKMQEADFKAELKIQELEAQYNKEKLALIHFNWEVAQKQMNSKKAWIITAFIFFIGIFILFLGNRKRQKDNNEIFEMRLLNKEIQFRSIEQYYDLIGLDEWVRNNFEDNKAVRELIHRINNMIPDAHWELNPKFYDIHYKAMFENFKNDFPFLDKLEFGVLCLISINLYKKEEIAAILEISLEDLKTVEISMKSKLSTYGYNFDKLMRRSRIMYNIDHMNKHLFKTERQFQIWYYKLSRFFKNKTDLCIK